MALTNFDPLLLLMSMNARINVKEEILTISIQQEKKRGLLKLMDAIP